MADYIPKPDVEASALIERVVAAIEADEAAFGLLPADSLALRTKLDDFKAKLAASSAAKAAATNAVAAKDVSRVVLEDAFRPLVQRIQVNPAVADATKSGAGLPLRDTTRTTTAPIAPTDLVVVADGAGVNRLKWSANGNTSGIQYVVEAKIGAAVDYSTVDVRTSTTLEHGGRVVGQGVDYRVRARRGDALSAPSNVGSVHR
jgi:hypothetical protein